jgi:hypothetical protein
MQLSRTSRLSGTKFTQKKYYDSKLRNQMEIQTWLWIFANYDIIMTILDYKLKMTLSLPSHLINTSFHRLEDYESICNRIMDQSPITNSYIFIK